MNNPIAAPNLKRAGSGALNDFANVLDYIPAALIGDIQAGVSTVDVSNFINDATLAAKEVYFPAGLYNVSLIETYGDQTIRGAGRGTQIVRSGSDPCFVSAEWLSNNPVVARGGSISSLSFSNGASAPGGFGIVGYNYDDRYRNLYLDSLGISLVSSTQNGTASHAGQTQNHHLIDIDVRNSPDGALYSTSKITDTWLSEWAINNCGRADRFAIEMWTLSGWHIAMSKSYSCAGGIIRDTNATQNLLLSGNNFEWDCTAPQDGLNLAVDIHANGVGNIVIADNMFRIAATDQTKSYQFLRLTGGSRGIPLAHVGNGYWVDQTVSGTNVVAAATQYPQGLRGCSLNSYNGFTGTQAGNLDSTLKGS